jgi:hypothetical protein
MTTTLIPTGALYVALELGCDKWVLASVTQATEKPRFRTVPAPALAKLHEEIAKLRIAVMDLRYVEESDPTCQALLEIYAATVLKTPYNDFENH